MEHEGVEEDYGGCFYEGVGFWCGLVGRGVGMVNGCENDKLWESLGEGSWQCGAE